VLGPPDPHPLHVLRSAEVNLGSAAGLSRPGPFQTWRSTVSSQGLLLDLRGFQSLYLDFVGVYLHKIILRLLN
jgi:hypothetical protein